MNVCSAFFPPQAVAKIAVRSGEPFRVQCYSMLAATRQGSTGSCGGSSGGGGGGPGGGGGCTPGGTVAGGPGGGAVAGSAQVSDPLGVAASVGPALDVLDQLYAGMEF